VWVAENPDHLIHFNGERFLGPYPDVMPKANYERLPCVMIKAPLASSLVFFGRKL